MEIISPVSLFADDSKLFSKIVTKAQGTKFTDLNGHEVLQDDLNKIQEWAIKWKMDFNVVRRILDTPTQ